MKLYEFTYSDNENLPQPQLLERISTFLAQECETQGWASGYTFRESKAVESRGSEKRYSFEVFGEYFDSEKADQADVRPTISREHEPDVAAKDASV